MVNRQYEPTSWDGITCEPGEKHYALFPHQEGWYETWYCTRCRAVETIEAEGSMAPPDVAYLGVGV